MGGLAPGQLKSRRGSHSSPRRLHYRLSFFDRVFKNSLRGKTLSILWEWRILIAIDLRQPGPLWSAKLAQSYAAADTSRHPLPKGEGHPRNPMKPASVLLLERTASRNLDKSGPVPGGESDSLTANGGENIDSAIAQHSGVSRVLSADVDHAAGNRGLNSAFAPVRLLLRFVRFGPWSSTQC